MSTPPPLLSGDSLNLSCEIDSKGFNLVQPTVRWLGPDNKMYQGQSTGNKYSLTVEKVSGIHNGNWICKVQYDRKSLYAMTNVIIVGKYKIQHISRNFTFQFSFQFLMYFNLRYNTTYTTKAKVCGHPNIFGC